MTVQGATLYNNVGVVKRKLHTLGCWNIATDKREVDYWKSEVITFVVVLFLIFLCCRLRGESQGKNQIV